MTEDEMAVWHHRLSGIYPNMGLGRFRELVMDKEAWRVAIHEVTKSWT